MSVTVDSQPLSADALGFKTVGQVLSHLQRDNRLVVNVLIDGREPDLDHLSTVKQSLLSNHTLFIETADPREMALEVLDEVETHLGEADVLREAAAELLQRNQCAAAMEKLSFCFTTWQHAQESVLKTAQLLRLNLADIRVDAAQSLTEMLMSFTQQLKSIRDALESRDFVTLGDVLLYEMTETAKRWGDAIGAMRGAVRAS